MPAYVCVAWGVVVEVEVPSPKSQSYCVMASPESGSLATAVKFAVRSVADEVGQDTRGGLFAAPLPLDTAISPLLNRVFAETVRVVCVSTPVHATTTVRRFAS